MGLNKSEMKTKMTGSSGCNRSECQGGFREEIMAWCEAQSDVFYLIGMARNPRLEQLAGPATLRAGVSFCLTGVASRSYMETPYSTCKSWSPG